MGKCSVDKYLQLVKLEMEDVKQDLSESRKVLEKRFAEMDITNYVFLENLATLKSEMLGIERVEKDLLEMKSDNRDCSQLRVMLDSHFESVVSESAFPEALLNIIRRKLDKIDRYISIVE